MTTPGTPQPADDNGVVDPRIFDVGADTSSTPSAPPSVDNAPLNDRAAPQGPQPSSPAAQPTPVTPVRRGGLAGIVDEFRDILSGHEQTAKVYQDQDGNQYIKHEDATSGEKWVKIIGSALRGAAAGAAVGQGPGGAARAAEAGFKSADEMQQKKQQGEQQLSEEVKQANTERANSIKLKHDLVAQEFALTQAKTKATREAIEFSQQQLDREKTLGSVSLGTYKDFADFTRIAEQQPDFWKQTYKNDNNPVAVYDSDGNRIGVQVFHHLNGIGRELAPEGTKIPIYHEPEKPGDRPTTQWIEPTVPMTNDMVESYTNLAHTKMQAWELNESAKQAAADTHAEKKSLTREHNATAAKTEQETADLKNAAGAGKKTDGTWDAASLPVSVVEGNMDPSQLSKRSKTYDADLKAANQYSMERYGKPFDIAKASEDYKYANQKTTQDTLRLLRSLTGDNNNASGTLAQLQRQYDALGNVGIPKLSKIGNWISENVGSDKVTNFGATLLGVSDEMGKILGGGVATDSSRAEAREILDKAFSGAQGRGAIRAVRNTMANRQNALVEDNRYLMKQFGKMTTIADAGQQFQKYSDDGKWGWDGEKWVARQ